MVRFNMQHRSACKNIVQKGVKVHVQRRQAHGLAGVVKCSTLLCK